MHQTAVTEMNNKDNQTINVCMCTAHLYIIFNCRKERNPKQGKKQQQQNSKSQDLSLQQKVKSGMGSPDRDVSMYKIQLKKKKKNCYGCTALDLPELREVTMQTDWQAKHPSQVACGSEDLNH